MTTTKERKSYVNSATVAAAFWIVIGFGACSEMERVKERLRLRLEESHQHANAAAITLFFLGVFSAFSLNHSPKATSTFWQFLITFIVNLIPKADYRPSDVVADAVAYLFTTFCFGFAATYLYSRTFVLNPSRARVIEEATSKAQTAQHLASSTPTTYIPSNTAPAPSTYAHAPYPFRTPRPQLRSSAPGSARTPTSTTGGSARGSASGGRAAAASSATPKTFYTPKTDSYKASVTFHEPEEEIQTISSPVVKRFDELASAPGSAQERKRRRERLVDPEVLKSASKNQAVSEASPYGVQAYREMAPAPLYEPAAYSQQSYAASPSWSAATYRPSIGGGAQLPRSALSSPQLSHIFASPDRVRKLSDEEKRMRCKRWIAHAVLSRVEDTINQYARTKTELEHLKKHKANIKRVSKDEIERLYHGQKEAALSSAKVWSEIYTFFRPSGKEAEKSFLNQIGCKELYMFEGLGCSPDPLHVVSKVWEIHLDGESKKTQLYADAHVKCKSVKERFFNLERRFAGYRSFLDICERTNADEVEQLRRDGLQWFQQQIDTDEASRSQKRGDADKFWRFFECAMNDLAYRDEPAPESSFETGGYLFVLQSSGRLECSEHLQTAFCSEDRGKFCGLWNRACEEYKRSLQDAKKPNAFATAPAAAAATNIFGKTQAFPAAPAAGGGGAAFPAHAPLMPNLLGGGGGFLADVNQKKDHPASVLWPYYKLWFEHLMMKSIKHDVKDKSSSVLYDGKEISRREYRIDARMHRVPRDSAVCDAPPFFLFYLQPEENQHTRSQKPEEAWPMFKIHRPRGKKETTEHKLPMDRIDVILPQASLKHAVQSSFPVSSVDDVLASISLFSEQLQECLSAVVLVVVVLMAVMMTNNPRKIPLQHILQNSGPGISPAAL